MKDKYIEDIKDIKDIMHRSSRFISLSGFSGISAGILALIGAYLAYQKVFAYQDYLTYQQVDLPDGALTMIILLAIGTLILAIATTIYFTTKETKKRGQKIWDHQTRRLLINLFIPLITGGIVCFMFLLKGFVGIVLPLTLVFYGLSLVNASKYTLDEIRSLGFIQIILGLVALQFIGSGLLIWSIGFGSVHIVYGIFMQWKYKQ